MTKSWMVDAFINTLRIGNTESMPDEGELGYKHLFEMADRILDEDFSDDKLGRWLGWAQAAVVAGTNYTLEDMKMLNKFYKKEKNSMGDIVKKTIGDIVKNSTGTSFQYYRDSQLWYETDEGFLFPVPIEDIGTATFKNRDKTIMFMRYIRKWLDKMYEDEYFERFEEIENGS